MGKQNLTSRPAHANNAAVKMLWIAVLCLAAGIGIGYYFGKTAHSIPTAAVAPDSQLPTQAPGMDPAVFLASEATLREALAANPKDLKALINLGNLYYDNNKYQLAIDRYSQALEIDPNDTNVRTDMGSCYWSLGQADQAIREFRKSLESNPSHPQTLFNLGIVYLHGKSDMAEARKAWEKLIALNPNYPQRARIEQMLASMQNPPAATQGAPAASARQGSPSPSGTPSMEELIKRMKK
jgi:tetratricopeptide (TPR) repeat protein